MTEKKKFDFYDGGIYVLITLGGIFLLFLLICFSVYITYELKAHITKTNPEAQGKPALEAPSVKPVLYVTAVTPYVLLNTKDGVRLVTLDETLNEKVFKFSDEKETARFLSDISLNFEIVDYTGVYQ